MHEFPSPWHGTAALRFHRSPRADAADPTIHQGRATAPLKVQRAQHRADGRCELPILHTAGGLVGGDRLSISATLEVGSRALLTSVAAQKVYGTVGRSRRSPAGEWACQELSFRLAEGADLEWLPQEMVVFGGGLFEQRSTVELAEGASWLGAEVVRLGRTAAGEGLGEGRWRSRLQIRRGGGLGSRWEPVDRLELGGGALFDLHGMAGEPVFGSLVWAAPAPLEGPRMADLLQACRTDREGLEGEMTCGALEQGLVARYRGPSSTAARHWFTRIWARIRCERQLSSPELPRVWPFQENPLAGGTARPEAARKRPC